MEITIMMAWGLFVAVFSVVVGIVLARSLANKDDLISEKTLKLVLAPLELNIKHILKHVSRTDGNVSSLDNRISNLERIRENGVDKERIKRI